jgi:hypothetical protein
VRLLVLSRAYAESSLEKTLQVEGTQAYVIGNLLQAERCIKIPVNVTASLLNLSGLDALLAGYAPFTGAVSGLFSGIYGIEELHQFALWPAAGATRPANNSSGFDSIHKGAIGFGIAGEDLSPFIGGVHCAQHFYYLLRSM